MNNKDEICFDDTLITRDDTHPIEYLKEINGVITVQRCAISDLKKMLKEQTSADEEPLGLRCVICEYIFMLTEEDINAHSRYHRKYISKKRGET